MNQSFYLVAIDFDIKDLEEIKTDCDFKTNNWSSHT